MNTYRERLKANQSKPCIIPRCGKHRIHFSKYCSAHSQRGYQYGHPMGRRIRPNEYEQELAEVQKTIEHNSEHEGIRIAIKFFDDWLTAAGEGHKGIMAAKNFFRLKQEGLTGIELLAECAAIYLFQKRNPQELPFGMGLYIALALGVLCRRKNRMGYGSKQYIEVKTRRSVGKRIAEAVGLLLLNIANVHHQKDLEREARLKAYSQTLTVAE